MIQNPTLIICNITKRLCFSTARLNSTIRRKIYNSSNISMNVLDPTEVFNSVFESSVKSYMNVSKLHLLDDYFNHVNYIKNTYSFVIDEDVAKDIVEKIKTRTEFSKTLILEGNPGLGLITLNLLNYNIPLHYVSDSSRLVELSLQQIVKKHSERLILKKSNISKNADFTLISVLDEAQKKNLNATLILVTTSFYFLRFLVIVFLKNALWKSNCEIYVVLTSHVLNGVTNISPRLFKYLYYCAFHLLFVSEKLASYPSKGFLPKPKTKEDDFHLVRLSLNPNLFKHFKEEELKDYITFVTILGTSGYNSVIPTLEKWLPDCGPYLISKGVSMTSIVKDFSHQESIILFNIFKHCDGYKYFKISVNNAFESSTVGS